MLWVKPKARSPDALEVRFELTVNWTVGVQRQIRPKARGQVTPAAKAPMPESI